MSNPWWKPPKVVICYRRQDAVDSTGRLYKDLNLHFNSPLRNYLRRKVVIVRDFDNIPGGQNYEEFIKREIETSAVILAVIGNDWLKVANPRTGGRRIDDPEDSLRKELTTALSLSKPLIPVLVEKAQMPGTEDLPDALKPLAKRSAREVNDPEWDAGVERLVKDIESILSWRSLNVGFLALAPVALLLLLAGANSLRPRLADIFGDGGVTAVTTDTTATPTPKETATVNVQQTPQPPPPPPPTPAASPAAVPSTPAPTPTPSPTPVEDLVGTQWRYRSGNVVYIWDFLPGGRLRSRYPNRGTYLPDATWKQDGDTVVIQTSVDPPAPDSPSNPETYRGKIRGDRMEGTFIGLDEYRWTATRMGPGN